MTRSSSSSTQTVSAIAVIDLANELMDLSCLTRDNFEDMGAEFNALYSAWKNNTAIQEERLPENLLITLWEIASKSNRHLDLGLNIGCKVNHQAKGILAHWLFQCSTLSEAVDTFNRNIHLLNPSECWERSNNQDKVKLRLYFKSDKYPSIAVDRSMAAAVSWSSTLVGSEIKPISSSFTQPKPNSIKRYKDIFGNNIAFGAEENAIVFPKAILDQPITAANPYLKILIEKKALELSTSLRVNTSITEKVATLLSKDLSKFCQIEPVCQALHLSRSTLYRKLKDEGVSHTSLVKNARLSTIKRMEKRSQSHADIAEELGFKDIGSYYRFRKEVHEAG